MIGVGVGLGEAVGAGIAVGGAGEAVGTIAEADGETRMAVGFGVGVDDGADRDCPLQAITRMVVTARAA